MERGAFIHDADPCTITDPLDDDSGNFGLLDCEESENHHGRVDAGESDSNLKRGLLFIEMLFIED